MTKRHQIELNLERRVYKYFFHNVLKFEDRMLVQDYNYKIFGSLIYQPAYIVRLGLIGDE